MASLIVSHDISFDSQHFVSSSIPSFSSSVPFKICSISGDRPFSIYVPYRAAGAQSNLLFQQSSFSTNTYDDQNKTMSDLSLNKVENNESKICTFFDAKELKLLLFENNKENFEKASLSCDQTKGDNLQKDDDLPYKSEQLLKEKTILYTKYEFISDLGKKLREIKEMERASFEELKNNHPKESKDAHMELRTSDPLLYSQSVVNLAVNDDYTQVHQSRTLSVKSPSSQRSAFESTDNILSSSFCEDCFEENILKWKPDPTKREQFCHDQEYEVEGTKQSNVAAFRRDEILERWRSEDTEYVQSVQGQLKMTENYGKASAGRSGQFTGLEGNFDQLHGQKKECIEEDTEENCMITNKIRSFGGFKFKRAEELDRKEVVRRQIREAKEHKRLFGEWVAKDWVVDEEEREMWEEAERKLAQTNENDEECLRYDGDATCLMTLEELKTRLKELEMEGKSEMEEEAEAGAEEEAEKGAEEMVEELMDQKKALNLEEEMDSKEKEERKKAREAKEKERMAIKKLIQKREQKEEKRQRLTKISELDRFLIQVGTEKQAQRKKWISEKQINEAKLELNEEEEERKNDFCLEQAELSTIDNKNEFCPSLTSILSLTPPPLFEPCLQTSSDQQKNFACNFSSSDSSFFDTPSHLHTNSESVSQLLNKHPPTEVPENWMIQSSSSFSDRNKMTSWFYPLERENSQKSSQLEGKFVYSLTMQKDNNYPQMHSLNKSFTAKAEEKPFSFKNDALLAHSTTSSFAISSNSFISNSRPINTENFDATPNFVLQQAQLNEPYSKFERTIVADTEEMTIRKSLKSCKAKAFSKQWKEISECCDGFNDNEQFHCVHSRITPICDMLLPLCYDASCHLPPLLSDKTSKYRVHRQKRAKKGIINMVRLLLHPKWPKHKNTIRLGEARRIAKVDAPMFV